MVKLKMKDSKFFLFQRKATGTETDKKFDIQIMKASIDVQVGTLATMTLARLNAKLASTPVIYHYDGKATVTIWI